MTEESKTIRLLLVDDHSLMRAALRETLEREPDIEVVGEAGDGETALAMLHELSPDLVLMDISMPGLNGIEATLNIISERPGIKVLALSTYLERRFVAHILNAGALGYISKTARIEELLLGVRTVMLGKRYLSSEIAAVMANTPPDKASQARLGRREIAVLKLIAQGRSSPEIAKALYIATGTVEVHRSNIMEKLDIHSIAELTRYAMREALIET
ncbi:MAG: response regulator transcription factor [Sulfuritalea sp.]|nr:response regulator transcription factor [Sulfuritalea sp.]